LRSWASSRSIARPPGSGRVQLGVVESALNHRLVPFARGVVFFKQRIEVSPGSRLACEDVWAAFQQAAIVMRRCLEIILRRRWLGRREVDALPDVCLSGSHLVDPPRGRRSPPKMDSELARKLRQELGTQKIVAGVQSDDNLFRVTEEVSK
jgi:hypothetical protein